jgi:Tfp pilus assembly protein PilO
MKLTAHEILRQLVFVVLLVGILAGAWFFVFRPRDLEDQAMRAQIAAKQKRLDKLNRAMGMIGDLKAEIADLDKAVVFFKSKLPQEKEIDRVLEEVWRLAEANELATKSIQTMKIGGASPFLSTEGTQAEQPIKMEFVGDFLGFYSFLLALEDQPRIMRIRQMTLRPGSKAQGRISAEVELSIFFERQDIKKDPAKWPTKS